MDAGEGCRAVASRGDGEAGPVSPPNELRLGKPSILRSWTTRIGLVLTGLIVLALRATPGAADIGIGSMDVYRPNIDPVALVAIAAVTAVVGIAAAFVPARRAVRMDPLMALRHE